MLFCQVHVAVAAGSDKQEPEICALRKTGMGSLPWALLPDITALAISAVPIVQRAFGSGSQSTSSEKLGILQGQFAIQ